MPSSDPAPARTHPSATTFKAASGAAPTTASGALEGTVRKAAIIGLQGPVLTTEEAGLLLAHPPAGVILFGRNIHDPAQLAGLIAALRRVLPEDADVLVDQEGGRVARLRPPHWQAHKPAGMLGAAFAADPARGLRAAWLTGALIGLQCRDAGITAAAAPVLDLAIPGAHDVIGDRAYGSDPVVVGRLGRAVANGLLAAGVTPIGKHAPGHGRAGVDSHLALPVVDHKDMDADLRPFALNADLPWMMTAHIVYPTLDPLHPATLSERVIGGVIRGRIGFAGVLVSDDLAMQALSGTPAERAVAALAAGCDVALYCAGDFAGNESVLRAVPGLTAPARRRLQAGRNAAASRRMHSLQAAALAAERERMLS